MEMETFFLHPQIFERGHREDKLQLREHLLLGGPHLPPARAHPLQVRRVTLRNEGFIV